MIHTSPTQQGLKWDGSALELSKIALSLEPLQL